MTDETWWSTDPPWTHEIPAARFAATGDPPPGVAVFELDGSAMADLDGVFTEFAEKLSFPAYFGRNWAALRDCLGDLTWLPPATDYRMIVRDWPLVLAADPDRKALLRGVLEDTGQNMARVGLGPGRESVAFNTVLLV